MRRETTGRVRGTPPDGVAAARLLRRHLTPAEAVLWDALRGRKLQGLKFRRQHPIGPYVADFYCPSLRLVIEVDGEVHDQQRAYDAARTEHLAAFGYRVVRLRNEDVLHDLDSVLRRLAELAASDDGTAAPVT
ncbi:MAG: endonuclease domain-containing protein [Sphaerobacter sp.]|nr:endonuclease domain-containing protein [Sphaerobacter sp.]